MCGRALLGGRTRQVWDAGWGCRTKVSLPDRPRLGAARRSAANVARLGFSSALLSAESVTLQRRTNSIRALREDPNIRSSSSTTEDTFGMTDTSQDTLVCSSCHEALKTSSFTSNQLKKGRDRRCAMCLRADREASERVGASAVTPRTTSSWGVPSDTPQVAVGDKFEVWLPKGTANYDRRAWVARVMNSQELLPDRFPLTAPYYAQRVTAQEGKWISVHVTQNGGLQIMGEIQKPPLDETALPEHLRAPPPAAGAARTGETYAGAVTARAVGPVDRKVTFTAFAPLKSTRVYLEEVGGPGRIELAMLSAYCWQTPTPFPCPTFPDGMTFKVVAETPGRLFGHNTLKSIECRVSGRTYSSPKLEHVTLFSDGIDDDDAQAVSRPGRASLMVDSLFSSTPEGCIETIDHIVQSSHADFSDFVHTRLNGVCNAPPLVFALVDVLAHFPLWSCLFSFRCSLLASLFHPQCHSRSSKYSS